MGTVPVIGGIVVLVMGIKEHYSGCSTKIKGGKAGRVGRGQFT